MMMNKSQVGTRLLSVYIDTVGAIHVIVPTFALERGEKMAVLNTHLSDLQESVKQLSPMFKDDKVVTLVQTAKKELDILIGEATHFENTVCTFFGVKNIEELRGRMQRVSTITSNFSQASWGQVLKTIQMDIQRYKDDSQSQAYETLKKYVDEVLETYNGEIRTDEELTKDVLNKVRVGVKTRLGKGKNSSVAKGFYISVNWDSEEKTITDYHLTKRMAEIFSKTTSAAAQRSGAMQVKNKITNFSSNYFQSIFEPIYNENNITDNRIYTATEIKKLYKDTNAFINSKEYKMMRKRIKDFFISQLNGNINADILEKIEKNISKSVDNILKQDPFAFFEPGSNYNKITGIVGETVALAQFYTLFGMSSPQNPQKIIQWVGGTKMAGSGKEPGSDLVLTIAKKANINAQKLGIQAKNTTKNIGSDDFAIRFNPSNNISFSDISSSVNELGLGAALPFSEEDYIQLYIDAVFNVPFHLQGKHAVSGFKDNGNDSWRVGEAKEAISEVQIMMARAKALMSLYAIITMHIQSAKQGAFHNNQNCLFIIGQQAVFTSLDILLDIKRSLNEAISLNSSFVSKGAVGYNLSPTSMYFTEGTNIIDYYNSSGSSMAWDGAISSLNEQAKVLFDSSFNFGQLYQQIYNK